MTKIKSKTNEKIKLLNKLSVKNWRDKLGLFVIEGARAIEQAIDNKSEIKLILISDKYTDNLAYTRLASFAQEKAYVDNKLYDYVADTQNSQGIIAIAVLPKFKLNNIIKEKKGFILIVDRVQDPGNLGTIIRTAESAGYDGIICIKGTVDAFSSKVTRATVGANTSIPILYIDESEIENIKDFGYRVIATSLSDNSIDYRNDIYKGNIAIVVGNEGEGVSEHILNSSDFKITIPIRGKIESLNVGVATGIVIYESRRAES